MLIHSPQIHDKILHIWKSGVSDIAIGDWNQIHDTLIAIKQLKGF